MKTCANPLCGKQIEDTPGRRPKKYCGEPCKQKHWQAQKKARITLKQPLPAPKTKKTKEATTKVDQAVSGSETEFMGHPIPDGLSGVPLMVWKNDIKKKFKDAKKLPK